MVQVELIYLPVGKPPVHIHGIHELGVTVGDVIRNSGLLNSHPEIKDFAVGIFAQVVSLEMLVKSGDRIEIYRPLLIDPKEKRRQRAVQKKS